jgi:hypothetical protein
VEDPAMRVGRLFAIAALVISLAAVPAQGDSSDDGDQNLRERIDEAFRELMDQMRPALDEFLETLQTLEEIDSLEHYQRPEILPNGDIIIRRRPDAPPLPQKEEQEPEEGVKT